MSMDSAARELPADRFHGGVRLGTLLAWFAAMILAYLVLRWLAGWLLGGVEGLGSLLVIVLAVVLAQPLALLAEKLLVARWPSGRALRLEPSALVWRDRSQPLTLELGQTLNYWRWRFVIKRRRGGRVPTGHHLFALRLVQGESELNLYTFLPPAAAEALAARYSFYDLRRPSDTERSPLGGREAVFLSAENSRWETGAELQPADFEALLAHLAGRLDEFASVQGASRIGAGGSAGSGADAQPG
jgi:hypothetical protein